jgi:4'-phosphopantetheinyl transferase EntD
VTATIDPALERDIAMLAVPGLLIGHRVITLGDENALLEAEAASITSTMAGVRRASGAARIVARELLAQLGHPDAPVPKDSSGAPIWPAGIMGSIAHDDRIAVAAVGYQRDFGAIGIDVEPAAPLPADMLALVASAPELAGLADDPLRGRLLFVAKEAVYKAAYPLDGIFLEFHDIMVDLASKKAVTKHGRVFTLHWSAASHLVVLALGQA